MSNRKLWFGLSAIFLFLCFATYPKHPRLSPWKPGEPTTQVNVNDGLPYVWIQPGTFRMGCSPGDRECLGHEKPAHQVTISKGFWMGQTEVTQEAWPESKGDRPEQLQRGKAPGRERVSWEDARSYCKAVVMRLPSEAEWEYAARAGSTMARYGELDKIAWYPANSGGQTHDVGGKQANAWGLSDMLGNVYEWVADEWGPYEATNATDPQGRGTGLDARPFRGGSWANDADRARVSDRNAAPPTFRDHAVGFQAVSK